jgi:carbonic anhydrase/acetyltransferase-like protein (isoleucine patch superfamily)
MLIPYKDKKPEVAADAFIAEGAMLIGPVKIGSRCSVWFNAVLRADRGEIHVGEGSSVQDCCVLHGPVTVGKYVTVGHGAILHGATVEDNAIIGMNSVVLDGAIVGHGSVVAAGAVVPEGMNIPPRSLARGVPAKVAKEFPPESEEDFHNIAAAYYEFARPHIESSK